MDGPDGGVLLNETPLSHLKWIDRGMMGEEYRNEIEKAKEEGKREAEKEQAKSELQYHLIKHLLWFVFGCFIGGGAAIEGGEPFGTVVLWACITGFVVSFIKWILFGIFLAILGC